MKIGANHDRRLDRRGVIALLLLAAVPFLVAAGAVPELDLELPATSIADSAGVDVVNFAFEDHETGLGVTRVHVDDTVTWVWVSGVHSVTQGVRDPYGEPIGPSQFDSGTRWASTDPWTGKPLETFSHTFQEPGVFAYYCRPHLEMVGVVVVLQ